ncbi:glutaredoxin domain-containing cysteine-rich protein CG31559 [Drosophila innubila]|uniref:glutaredoxin domain-containing cysteine-rich protein CG31559 n=1 Tax=Drosophila innubila TaxID=198719 RepID=UPI00148C9664|nr:glutaredoxin domain-containing cysteine-rich protein CG31559 [Drosophila innubila]
MVVQKAATPTLPAAAVADSPANCYMQQYHKYATHCETADSGNGSDLESNSGPVQPALMLTDDSEESEPSSLNSDSLNCSSTEYVRQAASKPSGQLRQRHKSLRMLGALLPDSLLRDIRDRRSAEYVVQFTSPPEVKDKPLNRHSMPLAAPLSRSSHRLSRESLNEESIEELRAAVQRANFVQTGEEPLDIHEATASSLPANSNSNISSSNNSSSINNRSSNNYKYADDQYYSFHINEHENFSSFARHGEGQGELARLTEHEQHDVFAGYRDVRSSASSTQSTIRSAKGTVRGVKNRVRNGIATFLQLQQQPNAKCYKEKDLGKVVLYTTSMGVIRDTYTKCANVKQILRTLLVKFEERDVFMSVEYQAEMRQRMQTSQIRVPQLYVEGQHIGDADTVERMNESGELRQLLKPYKSIASNYTCQTCGGYRLLPCPSCNGSKKSVHRNHFTAEFVALKCMNCDEVGLVKCHNC